MVKVLIVLFMFFLPASATTGQIYKWIDKKGSVHFTDNYQQIPREYRKQIEVRNVPVRKDQKTEKKPNPEKMASVEKAENQLISEGSKIFSQKCSKCHSLTGDNPMESATNLIGLLNRRFFNEYNLPVSEENIKKLVVEGGWDDMPAFPELKGDAIDELLKYLKPYMIKK